MVNIRSVLCRFSPYHYLLFLFKLTFVSGFAILRAGLYRKGGKFMKWIEETFGTKKPIIAMCHFQAMPGDLYYDKDGGMEKVVDFARQEFLDLQEGGVDAVMFSNEFSMPYLTKVNPETTACMARVIGELAQNYHKGQGLRHFRRFSRDAARILHRAARRRTFRSWFYRYGELYG